MRAVENDEEWPLLSPKDQSVVRVVQARALWIRLLTARIETGEPLCEQSNPRASQARRPDGEDVQPVCRFHDFAITLSHGTPMDCRKALPR